MLFEIITPNKLYISEDAELVRVPGSLSPFAMKHNHAPIISTIEAGVVKIIQDGVERFFEIGEESIVEQHENKITIVANRVEETYPILIR